MCGGGVIDFSANLGRLLRNCWKRKMEDSSLSSLIWKYTGLSEKELQRATWEEIDAMAQKRNGTMPAIRCTPGLLYTGSVYIMADRIGSLSDVQERWNKIGEDR